METSLPLWVLLIGALGSIAFFGFLIRSETESQSARVRWSLIVLRSILCLLVWALIAQPKAVTTREEKIPVSAHLGIDVSQSMSLSDVGGTITSRWNEDAEVSLLEEAMALTDVSRMRINLLSRRFQSSFDAREREVGDTQDILERAKQKAEEYAGVEELFRVLNPPIESLGSAIEQLQEMDESNPLASLERASVFASQAGKGLRRVAGIRKQVENEAEPAPRIDLVNRWLKESKPLFEKLAKENSLRVSTFSTDQTLLSRPLYPVGSGFSIAQTGGERTHLYENLNGMARRDGDEGRQLNLLITDGIDSTPTPAELSADLRNHLLFVLPIGDPNSAPDVRIESLTSPARVREKDNFLAAVEVSSHNAGPETVTVALIEEDQTLVSREVTLDGDGTTSLVELEWKAIGIGPREMRVEVTSVEGEEFTANNLKPLSCTVIKDQYRVLVCDAFPRWETRYLQNLFKRDASIEMTSIVFEPRHTYPGREPVEPLALPLALESWQTFDLVILGDVTPTQLSVAHQELLVEYVDKGGNLIILAGENSMPSAFVDAPIEALLPMIQNQPRSVSGTFVISPPENQSVAQMVNLGEGNTKAIYRTIFSITPQYSISAWNKAKDSSRALLVATDQNTGAVYDFFALQRFGSGKVSFLGAPCLYHLRFRYGDRYHARFWGQVIRGMCVDDFGFEGGLIETRLDRKLWELGSEVQGRVRLTTLEGGPMENAEFTASLIREGEVVAEMSPRPDPDRPGDYFFRFPDLAPGKYEVSYEGDEIQILLDDDETSLSLSEGGQGEFEVLSAYLSEEATFAIEEPGFWSEINHLPLAATISPQTLPLVLNALDFGPEVITRTSKRSIWDHWWFLLGIVAISGMDWFLRRINGLC